MTARTFFKESTSINVEEIQRKQHIHNLIENAWNRKLLNEKYNHFNNYSSTPKDLLVL